MRITQAAISACNIHYTLLRSADCSLGVWFPVCQRAVKVRVGPHTHSRIEYSLDEYPPSASLSSSVPQPPFLIQNRLKRSCVFSPLVSQTTLNSVFSASSGARLRHNYPTQSMRFNFDRLIVGVQRHLLGLAPHLLPRDRIYVLFGDIRCVR